jgi:hypothetical protein
MRMAYCVRKSALARWTDHDHVGGLVVGPAGIIRLPGLSKMGRLPKRIQFFLRQGGLRGVRIADVTTRIVRPVMDVRKASR